jgi:tRNA A37 threonylcarbamoyladenosine modification protein TsaB
MIIEIVLTKKDIRILLKNKNSLVDKIILKEINNLSNALLGKLDNIIRRNNLSKNQIKNISVKSKLPDSYTSARIAKSIVKSFVFAKKTT